MKYVTYDNIKSHKNPFSRRHILENHKGGSKWGLLKYIETKLQTTYFYLILSFFKKQKRVWN